MRQLICFLTCLPFFSLILSAQDESIYDSQSDTARVFVLATAHLNILYRGVENEVVIGHATSTFKGTRVSVKNATIRGKGPYKIICPKNSRKVVVTVRTKGYKPSRFTFKVNRIPDPAIYVGSHHGGRMQTNVFKAQQGLRATLENFVMEGLQYEILSAAVSFTGPNFPDSNRVNLTGPRFDQISSQISACQPGTKVVFDSIVVRGPDGIRRKLQNPVTFNLY